MSLNFSRLGQARQPVVASAISAKREQTSHPIQSGVCHALVLLGMGIEGMSCGGDFTPSGKF